jgi:tripartite-type tricarboxylate transporter receptor subunit TctC
MQMATRTIAAIAGIVLAALAAATPGVAQDWPARPVTLVYPFAPGGFGDVLARIIAPRLSESLGQPVVIENVAGAGGMVGSARVAKAPPDGYQFVLGTAGTHAANQTLYKHPLYDAAADFAPVTLLVEQPMVLIARPDFPAATLPELIAYTRAHQDRLQYGSSGTGSATHLACVIFNNRIGVMVTHVPYRSAGPAMQDLIASRIDYQCQILPGAVGNIQAGQVKAIAIMAKTRSRALPNLASTHEQGLADFETVGWYALFMPRHTPAPIVAKLRDAASAALDIPSVAERLNEIGAEIVAPERRSPDYLQKFVESEVVKWGVPIKASGVSMD